MVKLQLETSRKKLLKNNASKFLFFAWALERLVQFRMYYGAERINIGYLEQSIYRTTLIKESKESEENVNIWLQEMIFMGLIILEENVKIDQELVYITEKGIEAYKAQTYQIIAADLLEAEESRRLSRWAMWLSFVAIVIALFSTIFCTNIPESLLGKMFCH